MIPEDETSGYHVSYDRGVRRLDPLQTHQELAPARVNMNALFTLGTIAWLAGLAVLGILHLLGTSVNGGYALICVVGIVFGGFGFWWAHQKHLIDDRGRSE